MQVFFECTMSWIDFFIHNEYIYIYIFTFFVCIYLYTYIYACTHFYRFFLAGRCLNKTSFNEHVIVVKSDGWNVTFDSLTSFFCAQLCSYCSCARAQILLGHSSLAAEISPYHFLCWKLCLQPQHLCFFLKLEAWANWHILMSQEVCDLQGLLARGRSRSFFLGRLVCRSAHDSRSPVSSRWDGPTSGECRPPMPWTMWVCAWRRSNGSPKCRRPKMVGRWPNAGAGFADWGDKQGGRNGLWTWGCLSVSHGVLLNSQLVTVAVDVFDAQDKEGCVRCTWFVFRDNPASEEPCVIRTCMTVWKLEPLLFVTWLFT